MTCPRLYPLQYGFAIIVNGIWILRIVCFTAVCAYPFLLTWLTLYSTWLIKQRVIGNEHIRESIFANLIVRNLYIYAVYLLWRKRGRTCSRFIICIDMEVNSIAKFAANITPKAYFYTHYIALLMLRAPIFYLIKLCYLVHTILVP